MNEDELRDRIAALEAWAREAVWELHAAAYYRAEHDGEAGASVAHWHAVADRCPVQPDKEQP